MLLDDYIEKNKSYKKSLVFHFGAFAGFFSEYNNMLNAIAFCLVNKIQFKLYSADAVICPKKGWTDYLCSFLEYEEEDYIHHIKNCRFPKDPNQTFFWGKFIKRKLKRFLGIKTIPASYHFYNLYIKDIMIKRKYGFSFYTHDLWNDFEILNYDQIVKVPNLFYGTYFDLLQEIDAMIWHYNPETLFIVNKLINSIELPLNFAGLHIRAGDKISEHILYTPSEYMDKLLSLHPNIQYVFVFTDDYRVINELKDKYKNINFFTLCREDEQGFIFSELINSTKDQLFERTTRMFASVEILKKSSIFIGTRSSNPFFPVYLYKNKLNCVALDWS